jgi:hypothetical protein
MIHDGRSAAVSDDMAAWRWRLDRSVVCVLWIGDDALQPCRLDFFLCCHKRPSAHVYNLIELGNISNVGYGGPDRQDANSTYVATDYKELAYADPGAGRNFHLHAGWYSRHHPCDTPERLKSTADHRPAVATSGWTAAIFTWKSGPELLLKYLGHCCQKFMHNNFCLDVTLFEIQHRFACIFSDNT